MARAPAHRIWTQVTADELAALRRVAKDAGIEPEEALRIALQEYLDPASHPPVTAATCGDCGEVLPGHRAHCAIGDAPAAARIALRRAARARAAPRSGPAFSPESL